jgi:hypothetical protein
MNILKKLQVIIALDLKVISNFLHLIKLSKAIILVNSSTLQS